MISGTRVTRIKDRPGSKTVINVCKLGVIRIISRRHCIFPAIRKIINTGKRRSSTTIGVKAFIKSTVTFLFNFFFLHNRLKPVKASCVGSGLKFKVSRSGSRQLSTGQVMEYGMILGLTSCDVRSADLEPSIISFINGWTFLVENITWTRGKTVSKTGKPTLVTRLSRAFEKLKKNRLRNLSFVVTSLREGLKEAETTLTCNFNDSSLFADVSLHADQSVNSARSDSLPVVSVNFSSFLQTKIIIHAKVNIVSTDTDII